MPKSLAVLAAALLAGLCTFAPAAAPAAHAASTVKVAIIVGATQGTTPRYRSNADEVYREAIKYTSNVVRVYSPNATAARVKAAVNGASIIVYLGHGNGWPSPYTYDPKYTTKDGFGLNADLNGDGRTTDSENKYYGEPWIRDLPLAPNAVVLLFHLCYASGNPEAGVPEPSLTNAKKRVDNYAAAFLKAGARAVIANGHSHSAYYISALFTTRQTIDEYWRNAPDANGHVAGYPSTRSPGYSFEMDPEKAGSYYRSLAGRLTLRTQDVTGAPYADTSVDPASMVVPGNASPRTAAAPVYGSPETAAAGTGPIATLGTDARVHVDAREAVIAADGSPVYRVHAGDVSGWMTGSSLIPRDSAAPRTWEVNAGTGAFSPDGDGSGDTFPLSIRLSEPAAWTLAIVDGDGHELATHGGTSDTATITWAPAADSLPDGTYGWRLEALDGWGNGPLEAHGTFILDTAAPDVTATNGAAPQFSPNGDGVADTVRIAVGSSEPGSVTGTVKDAGDATVDTASVTVGTSAGTLTWDGRSAGGAVVADGTYTIAFVAKDRAGNRSAPQVRTVAVYGSLGHARSSTPIFFPQDGDRLASTTSLTFRLASAATVRWTVRNAKGAVVRTIKTDEALKAGAYAFSWNGRNDAGVLVPRGTYRSTVTATDGTFSATLQAAVVADAFRIAVSDATPARRQRITVTATSAENLDAAPRVRVYQPGIGAWNVVMKKVGTRVYRATVTLRRSRTGTLRLRVVAPDSNGARQSSNLYLPLH